MPFRLENSCFWRWRCGILIIQAYHGGKYVIIGGYIMKKLLLVSAFLLMVGGMPAPDGPMDPSPGYFDHGVLELKQKTTPDKTHADKKFTQKLCTLMNNPKNFKSMGMEKCHDCHCVNGMLICQCMHIEDGPVVRFSEKKRILNFNAPRNYAVVVVPRSGDKLFLGNKKDFLEKKLYDQYEQEYNPQIKDYMDMK